MEFARLKTLTLTTFEKNDKEALTFLKRLIGDDTIKKRFQGITVGLLENLKKQFFGFSFLVKFNEEYIGYINIGNYNEEEKSTYLRAAIDKDKRGLEYGKTLLAEITEYIFQNYPQVENIRLKIARDNIPSLMTAKACGYDWLEGDLFIKHNPYIKENKTK